LVGAKATGLQRLVTGARRPCRRIRCASESLGAFGAAPERVPDLHRRQRVRSTGNLDGDAAPVYTPLRCRNDGHFIAVVATSDRRGHRQDRLPHPSRHHSRNDSRNCSRVRRMLSETRRPPSRRSGTVAHWDLWDAHSERYSGCARRSATRASRVFWASREVGYPATAYSCQVSGTPLSSWVPRSLNWIPEPTTRSLTVRETSTSPGPASATTRAPM
jgi:hypothetical protein